MYQLTFTPSQNIEIQNNRRQPVPNKISFNPDTVLFDKDTRLNYEINNLKDLNYLNEVTGCILANYKSKNPKVNNTIAYLMKSENAVKFFSKVAEDLKSNPNNDEIDNFYINQIELSAEKLKPQPLLFNGMFHKKRDDIPFEKYFPVKELDMDEKEFNQAVRNILESPQKNEFIEAINEELAKKEKSADAASYINERNKDEAYKIPITVGYAKDKLDTGSIIGGSIIALKTALKLSKNDMDNIDKGITFTRAGYDLADATATSFTLYNIHNIMMLNHLNPELVSKTFIYVGLGLVALTGLVMKKDINKQRQEAEKNFIENEKYLKILHIAMQQKVLDSMFVGLAVKTLNENLKNNNYNVNDGDETNDQH